MRTSTQSLHAPVIKFNFNHRQWVDIQGFKLGGGFKLDQCSLENQPHSGAVVSDVGRIH